MQVTVFVRGPASLSISDVKPSVYLAEPLGASFSMQFDDTAGMRHLARELCQMADTFDARQKRMDGNGHVPAAEAALCSVMEGDPD